MQSLKDYWDYPEKPNETEFDQLNDFLTSFQAKFPEKLLEAEVNRWTICLPELNSVGPEIDETFFDVHILKDNGDWFESNSVKSLIVQREDKDCLKLLSGPQYQPSFTKGLYTVRINKVLFGVNKVGGKGLIIFSKCLYM